MVPSSRLCKLLVSRTPVFHSKAFFAHAASSRFLHGGSSPPSSASSPGPSALELRSSPLLSAQLDPNDTASQYERAALALLDTNSVGDLLLTPSDFPSNFKHGVHHDDLQEHENLGKHEVIVNRRQGHHRFFVRLWFKTKTGKYMSATFLCDTGAPMAICMGEPSANALRAAGCIKDSGNGYDTIHLHFHEHPMRAPIAVSQTHYIHQPANIIGVHLLARMGFRTFLDPHGNENAIFENLPFVLL